MVRPTLVILVGPPGCGKSTYAKKYIKEHKYSIYISSDETRKELWGNEATQGDNSQVFYLMQVRTIEALKNGQDVVYDATNMTRKGRASIISICPKFAKIEAHIIWAPIETCIERDASRERTVGKEVIDRMLKRFQAPYYDEGIEEIKVIIPYGFQREEYAKCLRSAMDIPHDNPNHTLNIHDHCKAAFQHAWSNKYGNKIAAAALYHDIGKPYVKSFEDSKGNPSGHAHYYQHQCVSAWMYYGASDKDIDIAWLISVHMDVFLNTKYYRGLPEYLKKAVDLLHECDVAGH